MAKKRTPAKKSPKKVETIPVENEPVAVNEPAVQTPAQILAPKPLLEITYQDKRHVLLKGIILHIATYIVLAFVLYYMNVPLNLVFLILMVLFWGLFSLGYAYYNKT